jgi:multiple sugar transport system ATP-binding protein
MDEPLSNLDAKLRVQTRAEIARIQDDLGVTTIYVTHDQVEAMTMGDRVAVMRKGELQQVAAPKDLYDHPVNLFVVGFIGSPAMNLIEDDSRGLGRHLARQSSATSESPSAPSFSTSGRRSGPTRAGSSCSGIRPEDLEDGAIASDAPADHRLRGKVELTESLGAEIMAHIQVGARLRSPTKSASSPRKPATSGRAVGAEEAAHTTIVGRFSPRSEVKEGDTVEITVDTSSLHFFDPETGLGIYDNEQAKGA